MKHLRPMLVFWTFVLSAQTGPVTATGTCGVANTGSSNTFTITCGIGKQQGDALLKIVNKILANQLAPEAVMGKLDEIRAAIEKQRYKSRVPSDADMTKFVQILSETHGSLRVVGAGHTDDVQPIVQRFSSAALIARWGLASIPPGGIKSGVTEIDVEGIECWSANWNRPDGDAFKRAMAAIHLDCTYINRDHPLGTGPIKLGDPDAITIIIGRQSR